MNHFSKQSKKELTTCHKDLQLILTMALEVSNVDFGISEGHRPIEKQLQYFKEGKSKIDGITRKGKHNYSPSLAADLYIYSQGKVNWDNEHLSYIAGIIHAITSMLLKEGKITHSIRWGGNWDMDGTILLDQSFDDRPHFELIKV